MSSPRRIWSWAWVPLAYLALTLLMTWPLAMRLPDSLVGLGDAQFQTWLLAWDAHALATAPTTIWHAPILFPYANTLAYHDHMLALAPIAAPIIWLTGNAVLAMNVLVLLSFVLSGWAVYALVFELCCQRWPAFIAGAAFAFCAYRIAHIVHLNLLQTMWLPAALLFLRRLLRPSNADGGRWRDALLFAACTALQCINDLYYACFTLVAIGGYGLLWAVGAMYRWMRLRESLPWRAALLALAGTGLTALLALPLLLPYAQVSQTLGIVRSVRELDNWSAPLRAYAAAPASNLLHRTVGVPLDDAGELVLFPGLLVTLLAFVGLMVWRGRERIFWGLIAAGAFVLSLGTTLRFARGDEPSAIPLPYLALYNRLPLFGAMRVPARWGMLVSLALAVLAGLALARLFARLPSKSRAIIGSAALLIVLLEQFAVPVPTTDGAPLRTVPPVYHWLGAPEQQDINAVLELPVGRTPRGQELERIVWRQFYSQYHWKALPVAFSGVLPFGMTDLMAVVQRVPAPDVLRYLQMTGVDTLVVHRDEYNPSDLQRTLAAFDAAPLLQHRADVGTASVYTLRPAMDLALAAPAPDEDCSVFVSGDDQVPGLLALGLTRQWREAGCALYGPGRVRYYAPLNMPQPGQVFRFGLLGADEDPAPHGFAPAGLRWRSNNLALYESDPELRVALDLGLSTPGAFHQAYPATLKLAVNPQQMRVGDANVTWKMPLSQAYIELDVASLTAQTLIIGATPYPLKAGASTVIAPIALGQEVTIAGEPATTALQRLRLRSGPPPEPSATPMLAASAAIKFVGSRLEVTTQAAGPGSLMLDVQGAAAYDDRPIHLLAGAQAVPTEGGSLQFDIDLLQPNAVWLTEHAAPADGRYIAYLKNAARPASPGMPVATFTIRGGALVDMQPVPLPLMMIR